MKRTTFVKLVERAEAAGFDVFYENGVKLGEILAKEDGFYDFWPELRGGFWASYVLKEIADHLDRLNEPWQKDIEEYFKNSCLSKA